MSTYTVEACRRDPATGEVTMLRRETVDTQLDHLDTALQVEDQLDDVDGVWFSVTDGHERVLISRSGS